MSDEGGELMRKGGGDRVEGGGEREPDGVGSSYNSDGGDRIAAPNGGPIRDDRGEPRRYDEAIVGLGLDAKLAAKAANSLQTGLETKSNPLVLCQHALISCFDPHSPCSTITSPKPAQTTVQFATK